MKNGCSFSYRGNEGIGPTSPAKKLRTALISLMLVFSIAFLAFGDEDGRIEASGYKVLGWNNLGMHCMDADFAVFSILPPYNTIEAQVIDASGNLVTNADGLIVTYEGVADPDGSVNTTSQGKTNFWDYILDLFGVSLSVDKGLAGKNMPGPANTPQAMTFADPSRGLFRAEGIPITPYDNAGAKNPYPLMRIKVKDSTGAVLAFTDIVLPVSDEMDCSLCHASGTSSQAMPSAGWVNDPDRERDYRLNVLRIHDDHNLGTALYTSALAARGFNGGGLYQTVIVDGKAVMCAQCHASEALPGSGYEGVPPLTAAVHTLHGDVIDPTNGLTLDSVSNRSACYRCHPGSETKCLRGTMGNAVAADGTMAIQCQDCHGLMSAVGSSTRTGWLDEPTCQQCHTGTAIQNNGRIRYNSVFDPSGQPRIAAHQTFATNQDAPAQGLSLYRFSYGHGGLQCSACHGSTHAEYPSSHRNDNIQNISLQGHKGTISECSACHGSSPQTVTGGPHGMHPVGQAWIESHKGAGENPSQCRDCHGTDYRGTVLSRSFTDRAITTGFGTKNFWRGFTIGCYTCHNGPGSSSSNPNRAPVVTNSSVSTNSGKPVPISLSASDPDGNQLALRVVSQPSGGTAGLQGNTATYFPYAGFSGTDTFTYAASDGSTESNLGTVTVTVQGGGTCVISCTASVPSTGNVGQALSFTGSSTSQGCTGASSYQWNFGDGGTSALQTPTHSYGSAGTYTWSLTVTQNGQTCSKTGSVNISGSSSKPPVISQIEGKSDPFRLVIQGKYFQANVLVFIGGETSPWSNLRRDSSEKITILGGSALKAKFAKGVAVSIRVVNPDGGSATGSFTRR